MITKECICRAIEKYREFFDLSVDDGTLINRFKTIADEILGAPVIGAAKQVKFLHVSGDHGSAKTSVYQVRANKDPIYSLGAIRWDSNSYGYAYFPQPDIVCNTEMLEDITRFIQALMYLRKNKLPEPQEELI